MLSSPDSIQVNQKLNVIEDRFPTAPRHQESDDSSKTDSNLKTSQSNPGNECHVQTLYKGQGLDGLREVTDGDPN